MLKTNSNRPTCINKINEPEKVVMDFLSYIENESHIRFDMQSMLCISACILTKVNENGMTISMPADFYTVRISIYNVLMKIRYIQYEDCNEIHCLELFSGKEQKDIENAQAVYLILKQIVPDIQIDIDILPDPGDRFNEGSLFV